MHARSSSCAIEGQSIASPLTLTWINSDAVNAFAVPGCYIYVTRELVAVVKSAFRATVRNNVARRYRKIGVNRRSAAALWARERGIG